jgi:hypothetical protein
MVGSEALVHEGAKVTTANVRKPEEGPALRVRELFRAANDLVLSSSLLGCTKGTTVFHRGADAVTQRFTVGVSASVYEALAALAILVLRKELSAHG